MSRTYNLDTHFQEVLRLLTVDPNILDSGYVLMLRREAWDAAGRSSCSQVAARMRLSQPVQEEFATIAMTIETSTLGVERKHNLDRRSGSSRAASVAKASRAACVRQWQLDSRAAAPTAKKGSQGAAQELLRSY